MKIIRIFYGVGFLVMLSGVAQAANLEKGAAQVVGDILKQAPAQGKRLAVGDFSDSDGKVTDLSLLLEECLENSMVHESKISGFHLVDRRDLETLRKEWSLGETGMVNEQSVKQVGKLAGVDDFLVGRYTTDGKKMNVRVKLIESETGEILATATVDIKDRKVKDSGEKYADSTYPPPPQLPSPVRARAMSGEKSPMVAGLLGLVVPGGGQLYTGHYGAGALSFILTGVSIGVALGTSSKSNNQSCQQNDNQGQSCNGGGAVALIAAAAIWIGSDIAGISDAMVETKVAVVPEGTKGGQILLSRRF